MLNFEKLEQILEELQQKNLFNVFLMNLLEYNEKQLSKFIVRYKIEEGIIIDIYDYNLEHKFIRYYFVIDKETYKIEDNNIIINIIDMKKYYNNYQENNKYYLFSSLFFEKSKDIIINNLNILFNKEIKDIILKKIYK